MTKLTNWDVAAKFTGREAAALIAGVDPDAVATLPSVVNSPMLERMKSSYKAKKRWYEDDGFPPQSDEPESPSPQHMLESFEMSWTSTMEPDVDGTFSIWLRDENRSGFEFQHFTRSEIVRWLAAISLTSVYSFGLQEFKTATDKPLGAKERESLLKMVLGMAVKRYQLKQYENHHTTAAAIASHVEQLGLSIDADTVHKYLKQAVQLMPVQHHWL